jgi:hypothetical protein
VYHGLFSFENVGQQLVVVTHQVGKHTKSRSGPHQCEPIAAMSWCMHINSPLL